MKKIAIGMVLVVAALAMLTTGVAFAQTPQPTRPFNGAGVRSSVDGPLHTYMVNALAQALGITPADFETRRDAGKTPYQIALDLGISADKIPALLADARAKAIDAALADGAITQQQADWMKSRGGGMGTGTGVCDGTGPHGNGGGMGRGGRGGQSNP